MTTLACIVGLFIGATIGVLVACLCNAASKNADYHDMEY